MINYNFAKSFLGILWWNRKFERLQQGVLRRARKCRLKTSSWNGDWCYQKSKLQNWKQREKKPKIEISWTPIIRLTSRGTETSGSTFSTFMFPRSAKGSPSVERKCPLKGVVYVRKRYQIYKEKAGIGHSLRATQALCKEYQSRESIV